MRCRQSSITAFRLLGPFSSFGCFVTEGKFSMDYGSSILARRPLANRDGVDAMAKCGEKHGLA